MADTQGSAVRGYNLRQDGTPARTAHVCVRAALATRTFIQFNSIQFNSLQFNSSQFNSIQFNSHDGACVCAPASTCTCCAVCCGGALSVRGRGACGYPIVRAKGTLLHPRAGRGQGRTPYPQGQRTPHRLDHPPPTRAQCLPPTACLVPGRAGCGSRNISVSCG